jgi:hypothetical protein
MKLDIPMPLLLKGIPLRHVVDQYIWLKMTRTVEVSEISAKEAETVLVTRRCRPAWSGEQFREPEEKIVAWRGRNHTKVGYRAAFPEDRMKGRPDYVGCGNEMSIGGPARPVMEFQSRYMFLESLNAASRAIWPKLPRDGGRDCSITKPFQSNSISPR